MGFGSVHNKYMHSKKKKTGPMSPNSYTTKQIDNQRSKTEAPANRNLLKKRKKEKKDCSDAKEDRYLRWVHTQMGL